jgi:ubiquilin
MYRDIQEPMLNVAADSFGRNPFAALVENNSDANNPQQGQENRDPLPNPWSAATADNEENRPPSARPASARGATGLFNSTGMQSLMQQMMENPSLMQNMLSAPYTQSMLEALAADPNMAAQIMNANPMFAGNPALQEQMRMMAPNFVQQLQNPEVQSMMTNPQALDALMQIQQGVERLRTAAPGLATG